jgi:tetratricopeptide (TPR) repeat protein
VVRALRAKDRKAYGEAIELAQSSLKYDQNFAEVYFLIAVVTNIQKRWDDAIQAGNKGLELLNPADDNDKAKYYFELGNAYAGKGDTAMACLSYREVSVGTYLESAKYQIEQVLKCN